MLVLHAMVCLQPLVECVADCIGHSYGVRAEV